MRILVIGGTRFIGAAAVRSLHGMGHEVTVFYRGREPHTQADLPAGVVHVRGDRRRIAEHAADLRRLAPDVVLDMVAMTERDAHDLVAALDGTVLRLVAISSQDVYRAYGRLIGREPGPPDPVPLDEEAPLRERLYPYRGETPRPADDPRQWIDDYDKILVERVVMGTPDLQGTVLRLPMVYGPGDGQHRLFEHLKRMDNGRPAILLGEATARWRWTRGYMENVAAAIALAVTEARAAGRVYNLGEPDALTTEAWVRAIGRAAGWSGEIVALPSTDLPVHLRTELDLRQDLAADTTRVRRELGYAEPLARDEALQRTVAWERAHPPEEIDPAAFDYAAEDAALARIG